MSFNRENIIWQSPDGTWSRAFYDHYPTCSDSDEDYDPEWDVEYTDDFNWVSGGHATEDDAARSWRGASPGGHTTVAYTPESAGAIEGCDDDAAQAHQGGLANFYGPKKPRSPRLLARELAAAIVTAHDHKMRGFSNQPDPRIPAWRKELNGLLLTADDEQRRDSALHMQGAANTILAEIERQKQPRGRYAPKYPTEAVEAARAEAEKLQKFRAPKRAADTAANGSGAGRRKTTPGSTAGSFAPKNHTAPEVSL